ncbi:MAG: alpha-2-macroglobulin family protein, partial [Campylobacterota bacterium]|nr:alpha-2-macroglobulin family protein [Campylobacterota bacterium]
KSSNTLRIEFNAPIAKKNALKNIKIHKLSNLSKSKLNYSIIAQEQNAMVLKINESIGYMFEVSIQKSLTSINSVLLGRDITKRIAKDGNAQQTKLDRSYNAMEILDKPRIIALNGGKFAVRLYFNDTIERSNLKKFVKVLELVDYSLGEWDYIYYDERSDDNISSSYSIDITSDEIKPNKSYGIVYNKGLRHYQELKETTSYRIDSGDMKRSISFGEDKSYLSNIGEVGFTSVNLDRATLIVEQVTTDNYRYFINYNEHKRSEVSKYTKQILSKELLLNNPKNKPMEHKFRVQELMGNLQSGVYKITLNYEDKQANGIKVDQSQSKVLFISDIGIAANIAQNQAFVSLISLSKALPIAGAKVKLYSKSNILIASAISDNKGIVKIDQKGLLDQKPNMIIVSHGSDQNFLLIKESSNSISYEDLGKVEDRYKAFVYAQSEIIRPASTLNALLIIKDRNFVSASNLPIKVELYSVEEYTSIFSKVYNTNDLGLVDFNYTFDQGQSTGTYSLNLYLGDKKIGSQLVAVESFIPPKIENSITLDRASYHSGDFIDAKLSSNYLFGMPASGLSGTLSFEATHKLYSNDKYPNHSFNNAELESNNELTYIYQKENITLDEKGHTSLLINTTPTQKAPSILKGLIGLKVMDDTQPVSSYKEITIYPYKQMVGVAINNPRVERGESIEIHPILINPRTSQLIDQNLTLNIKKLTWHYRYINGNYKWDKEIELIESQIIASNASFSKHMHSYGEYIIEVVDPLGRHSATQYIDIWGWNYASLSPKKDLKSIQVEFEDREYSQGDTLVATIKSPILEGYLLVTLEKEGILWHSSMPISKGVAKVEVPIEHNLGRGAYLHSTVVRKSDTSSKIVPYRASSYELVKSNRNAHKIKVDMQMSKLSKSHSSNRLSITADREATLLVSVVDVGILNMVSQKIPEIFKFFNDPALKRMAYFDLYDKVMSFLTKGSLLAFGSDGGAELKRKKHLPPKVERVKPFMLWSKLIKTQDKRGNYSIDIPQFNGRARVVVIATTKDAIGVASQEFTVRDDIIIKPSYPRFMLIGDRVELPIRLFNNTESDLNIILDKQLTPNLTMTMQKNHIVVPAKSSKVVTAKLLAKDEGIAKVVLSANDGKAIYTHNVEFGLFSPYALSTKAFKGSTTKPISLNIPDAYRFAKGFVYLSDNPLGMMRNDINYLINYPYGCAEQTSSKINAMYFAKAYLKNDRLIRNSQKFIAKGIKRLVSMQNYTGLFSYWGDGNYIDYYASIYASETLLRLHKAGYPIDNSVIEKIYKGLKSIVKSSNTTHLNRNRLYAAYLLATYDQLELSSANMLYDNEIYKDYYISWYYMSIIYQHLNMPDIAQKIYGKVQKIRLRDFKEQNFSKVYGGYTTMNRDMALVLYLNSRYFSKSQLDFDTLQRRLNQLYSTHEKAMALQAIDAYIDDKGSKKMDVNVVVNNQAKVYKKPTIKEFEKLTQNTIGIEPFSGVANYSVEVYKHLPKAIKNALYPIKEVNIKRDFMDRDGKVVDITNLKQGEMIYSKLTITNTHAYSNMIINHRIPACLDIDNMRLSKSSNSLFKNSNININNSDIRDDRVLYFANLPKAKKSKKLGANQNEATIYTPLMVTTKGECQLPAVTIEAMYD